MIFISLITGVYTVKHHAFPLHIVPRYHNALVLQSPCDRIPRTMGLHIILSDHVKSVRVTKRIDPGIIRIMTGTDRIDIVALHRNDIFYDLFCGNGTACFGTELMTVHAFKDDPLSV